MTRSLAILATAALLLAGCGADPSGVADDWGLGGATREPLAYPGEGHGAPDQDALDRLMAMARAHRALAGASYTARIYARGTFGGEKPKDAPWAADAAWEGRTVWEVAFAQPGAY